MQIRDLVRASGVPAKTIRYYESIGLLPQAQRAANNYRRYQPTDVERLRFIARTFPHSVWLNPMPPDEWYYSTTVKAIRQVFTMYELTLDGLEKAVQFLTSSGK